MVDNVIQLNGVSKSFGKKTILNNISFTVTTGEIVGLIGPSGAGKSTLIKLALGMEKTDGGEATVFDRQMPNRLVLKEMGYMAQSDALYDQLSGRENLKFFAAMKDIPNNDLATEIERVAKVVELTDSLDANVSGYSGGMKRRLSLAISLLGNPKLLILDEPTVGIDPALRKKIWHVLHAMRDDGHAILVTTHVMDEAELVDRVSLLLDGKLIANDTPKNLEASYGVDTVEQVFLKAEGEQDD
ncbi:ABC-2 type transport system ATP-binding protein [Weissella uvarum]|uniref:ABC transporter ATP-binding protein n=1 Tax=Weissella uvarum TaxID=1479233 RepID=UPI0019602986|nr:ABC transporter ATP-binding protein [Weissella uvarum]MBM7617539.1 ABC-2 type transport system ATP-binding protein [Weissella uvarum]MCM0595579.1 ABC transporter ATP-binding protein [Weissella uvarum]